MIAKILVGMIVTLCLGQWLHYTFQYKPLQEDYAEAKNLISAQAVREAEQVITISKLEDNLAKTSEALQVQTRRNSEIEAEKDLYLDIFRRHKLSQLAAAKPGRIEPLFNKGTKDVFDSIEASSSIIDALND